jgi:hypothetical protein
MPAILAASVRHWAAGFRGPHHCLDLGYIERRRRRRGGLAIEAIGGVGSCWGLSFVHVDNRCD